MPTTSTLYSSSLSNIVATTVNGVTHIDLNFTAEMVKGSGSIFVTDGAVQTVIDRVTGQPTLRVVGASFTKVITLDQVKLSGTHVLFDADGLPPDANLNVYMGAGTLLSGGKAAAAITVPGSAAFSTPVAVEPPPPPPSLGASIALDGSSLKSGQEIVVTISFNKPVLNLDPATLSAGNASIGDLEKVGDGSVWKLSLTGAAATDAAANVLRLDLALVTAADGSHGAGIKESTPYLVDTLVAAYLDPVIQMYDDNGPDDMDGVTNGDAMGVGGLLHGALKDGEFIELVINGDTIDATKVEIFENTYQSGTYYWYYFGEEGERFDLGENAVQARIARPDGHGSAAAGKTVLVERDAPGIVSKPSGLVDAGKAITLTFDEAMYWNGHSESSGEIVLVDGFGNTSWIDMDESMLSEDGLTLTLTPSQHNLATGNSYTLTLPDDLTDLAGNEYGGPAIAFGTAGDFQDKAAPRLVQLYIANGSGVYGKGDVLEFRLRYTEKVNVEAGTELKLYLDNGKVAEYAGLTADGKQMRFSYTVEAGDDIDNLDYADPSWTLYGNVHDDAGNVFQHVHAEYEGLSTEAGYGARIEIDTVAATPAAPQLHASSEASAPGNGTTTDTRPRLTGSGAEAFATIAIYAGSTKVGSATADGNGNWDTVLDTALATGAHQITVTQKDRADNVSTLSNALPLTVSAPVPTSLAAPVLDAASDSGVSDSDGITHADQPALSGKGPANTALVLKQNGAVLATVTTDANGDWHHTVASLADGVYGFSVHLDAAGLASTILSVTVDRSKPSVTASPDGLEHVNPGGDIVITFNEAVHIASAVASDGMLVLVDTHGNRQEIAVSDANLSSDKRSLTIGSDMHNLAALTGYRVHLPTTLTDLAGNGMSEYEIHFSTGNDALPSAVRAIVGGDGVYRAGDTIDIRIRFNEQVEKQGESALSIGLSNGARAVYTGMSGNDAVFSYTVAAGHDAKNLQITDPAALAGRFADLSGNLLDGAYIDFTGLYAQGGYGSWFEADIDIDTVAAAPDLPLLAPDSNSGSKLDLLTKDRTPTLSGSSAEAHAQIDLYEGDALLGSGYADANGDWEVTVEAGKALGEGTHQLTVRQTDMAGNLSPASAPLGVTIDTTVAVLAAPRLAAGYDTGSSATDNLTRENRPVFAGSGAEAGATIKLMVGSTVLGLGSADADGDWEVGLLTSAGILADGGWAFTVRQEDGAGNLSEASAVLALQVDRTAPAAPAQALLLASSDTGASDGDGVTSNRTPTFTGSGALANTEIALYVDGVQAGSVVTGVSGNWSIAIGSGTLTADKSYSIATQYIDAAGNKSALSSAFNLVLDTTAPTAAPAAPDLDANSDSGALDNDNLTNDTTPTFSGSGALPNSVVALIADGTEVGRAVADPSGNWSITSSTLLDGAHQFRLRQFDLAGNQGPDSAPLSVTIDTAGPVAGTASLNLLGRKFSLPFDESIVFTPSGRFKLLDGLTELTSFWGNNSSSWNITQDGDGDWSVLNFNISLNGLLKMQWTNGSVTDLAGNVAVIGTPEWIIDMGYPA